MKGLPNEYKPFVVVTTQSDKVLTFPKFKIALRSYEENGKANSGESKSNSIMKLNFGRRENNSSNNTGKIINCFSCGLPGPKLFECSKQNKWYSNCRSSLHTK